MKVKLQRINREKWTWTSAVRFAFASTPVYNGNQRFVCHRRLTLINGHIYMYACVHKWMYVCAYKTESGTLMRVKVCSHACISSWSPHFTRFVHWDRLHARASQHMWVACFVSFENISVSCNSPKSCHPGGISKIIWEYNRSELVVADFTIDDSVIHSALARTHSSWPQTVDINIVRESR